MATERGKLTALIAAVRALHEQVAADVLAVLDEELRVYDWRPRGAVELPALYLWMGNSPYAVQDMATGQDSVLLLPRIGIRHTDVDEEMALLTKLVDSYMYVVDVALWEAQNDRSKTLLDGVALRAVRGGMRPIGDTFGEIPVLAMELPLTVDLNRRIRA